MKLVEYFPGVPFHPAVEPGGLLILYGTPPAFITSGTVIVAVANTTDARPNILVVV
eukprot:m.412025 g.412025  ORF g.412025 m.412025 type:complete len:56 (+) comp28774_c0_seq1:2271-2438(+)